MSKIVIRPAHSNDAPAITEIYNHAIVNTTATFDTEVKSVEDRLHWLSEHGDRYPIIIAELDGKIVGWGSLSRYGERPGWRFTVENGIYVSPDAQGIGVGRKILEELIVLARELGYHAIVAQIVSGNDASVALHEKCGFERVGVLKEIGHKFGRWLDLILMEKLVKDG